MRIGEVARVGELGPETVSATAGGVMVSQASQSREGPGTVLNIEHFHAPEGMSARQVADRLAWRIAHA